MQRKITQELRKWQENGTGMPLVLYGARQVGKSYAVEHFGKDNFDDFLMIDFEENSDYQNAFLTSLRPRDVIQWLARYFSRPISENTLIFFDEVQLCPRALTSLKYFNHDWQTGRSHYQVIAAGSMLGVTYGKVVHDSPYPVGQVKEMIVHPMDFEEFLWAHQQRYLAEEIRYAFTHNQPLPEVSHQKAQQMYRQYLVIGGMPAAVEVAVRNGDFLAAQKDIINQYRSDMVKYILERPDKQKTIRLFDSVSKQLGSEKREKRFLYSLVEPNGTAKKYRDATDWLVEANLIIRSLVVRYPEASLYQMEEQTVRKLYMMDTGLLCHKLGITLENLDDRERKFMGAVAENYVACHLARGLQLRGSSLHFWKNDPDSGDAEVDFLIPGRCTNIPIEVKTGYNTKSQSLRVYLEKYQPELAYRVSAKDFGYDPEKRLKSIPHYAVFCI